MRPSLRQIAEGFAAHAPGIDLPMQIGIAAALATAAGGGLALALRNRLALLTAFGAGAVVAAALVDLLPEAIQTAGGGSAAKMATVVMAGGFGLYLILDKVPQLFRGRAGASGFLGPASLSVHSFLDGFGIATAFQASESAGWVVALAVLAHDLLDGSNTVVLASQRGGAINAILWLAADATAPIMGVLAARWLPLPPVLLAPLLALFAGFFLYIGAGELLPRSRAMRPAAGTALASAAGLFFVWGLTRLAGA